MTELLIFSGSSRAESFNSKLAVRLASMARNQDADASLIDLGDLEIPIYNGDLEAANGLPDGARRLKRLMQDNDGLVIACPEYNGFMTPLLLNAMDWCTRSEDASGDLSAFADKPVLIASASPGPGGGSRANTHLKTMLSGIGAFVFPHTLTVPAAHAAFDDQGEFVEDSMTKRAQRLIENFVEFANRLK